MKFTLSWLKEHLDTTANAEEIAAKLTSIGLEVEAIEDAGARLKGLVVGHVLSAEKHPNADKLKLCMVDIGSDIVQVVCGAPNAHTGMKGVFAPAGVIIPANGEVLKPGTIRGVESRGMLCSERELLLSEEHDGIIELPGDAQTGAPAADALGLNDPVIDIAITPNRGDATSAFGVARDLAAAGLGTLKTGKVHIVPGLFPNPVSIALNFPPADAGACPIFAGRLIRDVKNGPSPKWLQDKLKAVGLRPISALVDITNLVAHDRGRPLHVFDADRLHGTMTARQANNGETLIALDGKSYALQSDMTVIADSQRALGIAGVMGGEESGCSESTQNVFVESAWFDPVRTAITGRKLGIISDARYRFERGADPNFVLPGLELATQLILDLCGGTASEITIAGGVPDFSRKISFAPSTVQRLTGLEIASKDIAKILRDLGFVVEGTDPLQVTTPSWRNDLSGEADLVEEVVRIHGLENVPSVPLARLSAIAKPVLTPAQRRMRLARRVLAMRGFNETISYSFIPRAHAALFGGGDESRQIANPIASDMDALRPSLLPSLLAAAARNQARGFSEQMLFEIGAQFETGQAGGQTLIAAGIRVGGPVRDWGKADHAADLFDAKADMLAVLEASMGATMSAPIRADAGPAYHPGRSGVLALGTRVLAAFGELHPRILTAFDLKGPVVGFEIHLDAIPEPKSKGKARAMFQPSPYQAIERDFAFVVDSKVTAEELLRAARGAERPLIENATLFDLYEGKGVPEGKKSLAITVRLQPRDKTLTDSEIDAITGKIVSAVNKATGAVLRA